MAKIKCGSGGPKSKDGAWKRARKPLTAEAKASSKQDVGRKARQVLQRAMPELHTAMAKAAKPSAGSAMGEADKRLRALNDLETRRFALTRDPLERAALFAPPGASAGGDYPARASAASGHALPLSGH